MAKRRVDDNLMMGPRPNTRLPWLVILLLLACLSLVYWGFLASPPGKLLGPKIPANEYRHYLTPPKPVRRPPTPPASTPPARPTPPAAAGGAG